MPNWLRVVLIVAALLICNILSQWITPKILKFISPKSPIGMVLIRKQNLRFINYLIFIILMGIFIGILYILGLEL
jgi:hypothetical protein